MSATFFSKRFRLIFKATFTSILRGHEPCVIIPEDELTRVGMLDFSAARYGLFQTTWSSETETTLNAESNFCQSEVPNGRCDLCSLISVVAVFSG